MDEFRKHNPQKKQHAAVDGFIPSTPRLSEKLDSKHPDDAMQTRYQPIDAPKKADGFSGQTRLDELPSLRPYAPPKLAIEHTGKKKRPKLRKYAFRGSLAAVALIFICAGLFFGKLWWTSHKVLKGGSDGAIALNNEVAPELLKGEGDGRVNVLLLGKGGGNHPGADLTDSILIVSIDPIGKEASLLSIPRDLWVRVPDFWSMKINAVYSSAKQKALSENEQDTAAAEKAGEEKLSDIIETTIGIPIHYYTMVNFDAFKQAVDAVGGINLNVAEPLYDYNIAWENGGSSLIADAGPQAFDGKKALLYARSRYTSSDFARGQRQRELVVGLKEKVLQLGTFSNPVTVSKLLDAIGDNVTTNISLKEIMRMYEITKDIPTTSIASLGFTDQPNVLVKTDNINGQSVVVPRRGVDDFSEIQSFVRNSLRDGFLKSENASVVILNGTTTPGLATNRSEELKSYGYNVTQISDAPTSDYTASVLIDLTGGVKKYTKRYLEQRLGVEASSPGNGIDSTTYPADFVIIVGSNEAASP